MKKLALVTLLAFTSCSGYMKAVKDGRYENNVALREMSYDLEELKVSMQQAQIEIKSLEDRLQSQERELIDTRSPLQQASDIAAIEGRLEELKAAHKSTLADLSALNTHASKTSTSLTGYRDKILSLENRVAAQEERISEVVRLKKTLTSISSAIKSSQNSSPTRATYEVVAGDTLGKIALHHHTTVQKIKDANNLDSNRIIVGQKLVIPQ